MQLTDWEEKDVVFDGKRKEKAKKESPNSKFLNK